MTIGEQRQKVLNELNALFAKLPWCVRAAWYVWARLNRKRWRAAERKRQQSELRSILMAVEQIKNQINRERYRQ